MSPRLPALNGPPVGFGTAKDLAGASDDLLDGIQELLDRGAGGLESTAWVTADGVPVLWHEAKTGPRLRRRMIDKLDKRDLPENIPTLEAVYRLVGPKLPMSLNVGDRRCFDAVLGVARAVAPEAEAHLWLCHPELSELTNWRPDTTAKLINSVRLSAITGGLERRAAELEQRGLDGLNIFHSEWSGGRITLLHRFGLLALGWGVRYAREVAELVDAGIDGVYSEDVDRMVAVIREYYPAPPANGGR